jgi:hypothetical protein
MSESTRHGLLNLANKLGITMEYLILHLEDEIRYPIT